MNLVVRRINSAWRLALIHAIAPRSGHVLVNEYPKSGGSWVGQLLARSLHLPFPRNRIPGVRAAILHGHYMYAGSSPRTVIVWRDGRDVMLSWYFHCLFENERDNAALVRIVRRHLRFADYNDVVTNLPVFLEFTFARAAHPGFTWPDFVRRWRDDKMCVFVRYEDLRTNTAGELQRITQQLRGDPFSISDAEQIASDLSFRALSGRQPGQERRGSFLRKGVVGEWKEQFGREARRIFHHYAGEELISLGYEHNDHWVDAGG